MAARKGSKTTPVETPVVETDNTETLVKLFVILESFESTEDDPTATATIADEFNRKNETDLTATDIYTLLESMVGMVDAVRGEWFITLPDVTEENAEAIAREWLSGSVKPVESQTGLSRTQIAAELPSVVLETPSEDKAPTLHPAIESWTNDHESTIPDFEGPESIPAPPLGVNGNVWFMSFYANTETARKFWRKRVDAQLAEFDNLPK